jgi:hypothetical protein
MDAEHEVGRAKWLLFCGLWFIVSAFISYNELIYLLRGRTTQATVLEAYQVERSRGRFGLSKELRLVVEYQFIDSAGNTRKESDEVSPDWGVPAKGTIAVSYTPGKDGRSRLAGHVNWLGPVLFGSSLVVIGIVARRLWKEASEAVQGPRHKRKR